MSSPVSCSTACGAASSPRSSSAISQNESPATTVCVGVRRHDRSASSAGGAPASQLPRGEDLDDVTGVEHRRVVMTEPRRVERHQRLGELPHVVVRSLRQAGSARRSPRRSRLRRPRTRRRPSAARAGPTPTDAATPPSIRCRRAERGGSRSSGHGIGREAKVPTGAEPPRRSPHFAVGPDCLVLVQLPDLRPTAGVAEQPLGERLDRLAALDAGEPRRHGRFDGDGLFGVIELTVNGRGDASVAAETKFGATT